MPAAMQLGVELVGDFADTLRTSAALMGTSTTWKGAIGVRPDDAALIVILFDGRGHDARHTDAVAAHVQGGRLAGLVEDRAPSSPRCTCWPSWKTWPDLDAARDAAACPCRGLGSPATTLRRSATRSGSGRSRPQFTPVKCASFSLAPQTKSLSAATERSAYDRGRLRPTGPR